MFRIKQLPSLFRFGASARESAGVAASSLADRLPFRPRSDAPSGAATDQRRYGPAAGAGDGYNEEAFHYLLALERQRFDRGRRPFALALVAHQPTASAPQRIAPALAAQVLTGLAASLRETDVVGWYNEGHVVGAILTPLGESPAEETSRRVTDRITSILRGHVPAFPHRVDVQLYRGAENPK